MSHKSLEEVHGSIDTSRGRSPFRRLLLTLGPAFLVSVGYMDPGNWSTDLAGGSQYGYALVWVLVMSNLIALLLQTLSARLGLVRGIDLAQASRETYPKIINYPLFGLAQVAIAACDLAEVLGMAIGLNLLFGMPLIWGVTIALLDTFVILYLQSKGMRYIEMLILSLVFIIGGSFAVEMFFAKPDLGGIAGGLIPSIPDSGALYIAIGIIGATVMPHNLYLHSALVQTRRNKGDAASLKESLKFNFFDSAIALNLALLVNAAILILAAAVFHKNGMNIVELKDAHGMLEPLLGERLAPTLFAVALIASGQSSTITGTLAGQIIMEGYLHLRITPWLRRLTTRLMAVIPAFLTILFMGEDKVDSLLILSQVILSLQLGFAVIPLIHFTSDKKKMGAFANKLWVKILAWVSASVIVYLNIRLVFQTLLEWKDGMGSYQWIFYAVIIPVVLAAFILLIVIVIFPYLPQKKEEAYRPHAEPIQLPEFKEMAYNRILVCLDFSDKDVKAIEAAIHQKNKNSVLILLHVVESAAARFWSDETKDLETKSDQAQLQFYTDQLRAKGYAVETQLGFGFPKKVIPAIAQEQKSDLLVMASHGHRGIMDIILGETIASVRHSVKIPVLIA